MPAPSRVVVADWTGIPVGRMVKNEIQAVLGSADTLEKRVIGQRHALDAIARRIQTSRARLDNPNRPIGVFMLVGPSGTGKTETALTLAEALYGGEQNMISINMSEFQEAHTVSTLKGSPPGYVGYGEGGILTEAVRRRPYSVVLLDEVEKGAPRRPRNLLPGLRQGLDGRRRGRYIDFKNTIIILTSNAAQDLIINLCKDPDLMPERRGPGKSHAPAAHEGVPRRAPQPPHGRAVLSHQKEMLKHHQAQPRQGGAARAGKPQGPLHLRRQRARTHRPALHRTRTRRAHGGRDDHEHDAAGNRPRYRERIQLSHPDTHGNSPENNRRSADLNDAVEFFRKKSGG
jgi:hypothetical protein